MKTLPLLLCAAFVAELPAQSPLPSRDRDPQQLAEISNETASLLPSTAAVSVSTAARLDRVRFDRPRADGPLWALGAAWKASFDGTGFTAIPFFGSEAPRNFPLRIELERATVGGEVLRLLDGEPVADRESVCTDRGPLTEVVDTNLDQLEQSFVFATLPNRGAIAVDVRMHGEFATTTIENGLRFANDFGHVDYTKAVAVDAAGERLALDIVWTGECAHMEIPADFVERAQLPIVLDPVLNYWYLLGSGIAPLQHDSDTAYIQAPSIGGRTLLVWQRQWSATDQDCFGLMFDANLGLVQTDFVIDFTSDDWLKVAVAGANYAQNFLVVSEIRIGLLWFIGGRGIAANATVGSVFDIEREGVVGLPGNNFHPDIGCDPYYGPGRYTVVFQKRTLTTADIYMKQVNFTYGLVTTNPVALDTSTTEESRPSISKSCGQSNGPAAHWLVTWQRTYPFAPNDQEVHGRFVDWNGALPGVAFGIGLTVGEETAPSPGSPIDANGVRYWPMCYEYAPVLGQPRDVIGRLIRADGGVQAVFTASNNVPGADDREPEMDSDGTRFVVCLTTGSPGFAQGVESATFAFLPTTNLMRLEERTGLLTSGLDNYGQCNIVADFSGGSSVTPAYRVCFTEQASNTFRLERFGGYTSGSFFQTRATQCGTLSIAASGEPVLGQTVTITAANGPASGTLGGFPISVPLLPVLGCNCTLGVDYIGFFGNPFVYSIPNDATMVGQTFAIQGYTVVGSQCIGLLDLSDTIDFTIR